MANADGRQLEKADFAAAVGSTLGIPCGDGHRAELTVARVDTLPAPDGWESFAVMLDGPGPEMLGQATYVVEHPELGTFPLFLSPVDARDGVVRYEAVFNRQAPEGATD